MRTVVGVLHGQGRQPAPPSFAAQDPLDIEIDEPRPIRAEIRASKQSVPAAAPTFVAANIAMVMLFMADKNGLVGMDMSSPRVANPP